MQSREVKIYELKNTAIPYKVRGWDMGIRRDDLTSTVICRFRTRKAAVKFAERCERQLASRYITGRPDITLFFSLVPDW